MAWKETSPVFERMAFIVDFQKGDLGIAALCRKYNISSKTGYKWIARWKQCPDPGVLRDQSRCPDTSPNQTDEQTQRLILDVRREYPDLGPVKILVILAGRHPGLALPAPSTAGDILKRHGLVGARVPRRRGTPTPSPFAAHPDPNVTWAIDFKGWWRLGNGRICYPLTVTDLCSRYLVLIRCLPSQEHQPVQTWLEKAFREFGMPRFMRSDNGAPFGSTGIGGLSQLGVWLMRLGIEPERITPGRPEQNGSHERMHGTLERARKHWSLAPNMKAQQRQMDQFREFFNQVRPHQALNQVCPQRLYRCSDRPYPERLPEQEHPAGADIRTVSNGGNFSWGGRRFFIGRVLDGNEVALVSHEDNDLEMEVWFMNLRLGVIDLEQMKFRQAPLWRPAV
jgi:putative transposase